MAQVSIRMDEQLKEQAEILFEELGFNMTTAVTMFVKKAVRERAIPFDLSVSTVSERTLSAAREARAIEVDSSVRGYRNIDELFEDLAQ